MVAAALSSLALLVSLRRNKLMVQGLVSAACVIAGTAIVAPRHFDDMKSSFVDGVIYKGHQAEGLLGSRLPPGRKHYKSLRKIRISEAASVPVPRETSRLARYTIYFNGIDEPRAWQQLSRDY